MRQIIEQIEAADDFHDLPGVKKLSGGSGEYYRMRVGEYRIGLELEDDVVVFVRCLHRREIYRFFP